jgi:hypothetical protein
MDNKEKPLTLQEFYAKSDAIALSVLEKIKPPLPEQEQAVFIAGFIECAKYLSSFTEQEQSTKEDNG